MDPGGDYSSIYLLETSLLFQLTLIFPFQNCCPQTSTITIVSCDFYICLVSYLNQIIMLFRAKIFSQQMFECSDWPCSRPQGHNSKHITHHRCLRGAYLSCGNARNWPRGSAVKNVIASVWDRPGFEFWYHYFLPAGTWESFFASLNFVLFIWEVAVLVCSFNKCVLVC